MNKFFRIMSIVFMVFGGYAWLIQNDIARGGVYFGLAAYNYCIYLEGIQNE